MGSYGPKLSSYGQQRLWSDWAEVQADLSLCWAHGSFCWFCHAAAQLLYFSMYIYLIYKSEKKTRRQWITILLKSREKLGKRRERKKRERKKEGKKRTELWRSMRMKRRTTGPASYSKFKYYMVNFDGYMKFYMNFNHELWNSKHLVFLLFMGCWFWGWFESKLNYRKHPKISDTLKFAVITLKVEQNGFSLE